MPPRIVVGALQNFDRLCPRSRAGVRSAQRVQVAGRLLIARFNGLLKFGDRFREAPLIGQNPAEMIVRQTQPRLGRQRPAVERGGTVPGASAYDNGAQTPALLRRFQPPCLG